MSQDEKIKIFAHVKQLNKIINDDIQLKNNFEVYAKSWKPLMNTWIQPYTGKYLPSLFKRGILPTLISEDKKMLYTNLIRCESHRDILLSSINPIKI
jgi:poly-gamma-glutamate synthesis protein (capsule biosynthesis protein)